jgi:predicted RNase H-like HicB family nuclease
VARAYTRSDEAAKVLDVRKVRKEDEAMTTLAFDSYSEGRAHFKELLDAAQSGRPALVRRDGSPSAVVDAERLRTLLTDSLAVHPSVVAEAEGWSIFVPGVPIAADGASFDEALEEMVDALREYAEDWQDHLLNAPNHRDNWALVQLVSLSENDQLKKWLVGASA